MTRTSKLLLALWATAFALFPATATQGQGTDTLNIQTYAAENGWINGTKYTTANTAHVAFTITDGGGNSGKYYNTGGVHEWRLYQTESPTFTITVEEGLVLSSITFNFHVSNKGTLLFQGEPVSNGSILPVSGISASFTIGNSGSANNGQIKITNIEVCYSQAAYFEVLYDKGEGTGIMADTNSPYAAGTTVTLLENSFLPPTGKLWNHWQVVDADDQEITVLDNSFIMPSNDVTVTAIYREANTYQLVTDLSQVIAGRHYLIATGKNGDVKAMGDNKGNNRDAVDVTVTEGHITETQELHEFVISGSPLENEWWSLFDVTPEKHGYLYSGSSNNNYLKTLAESQYASLDDNGKWTIIINSDDGQYNAILTAQGSGTRKLMRYNSTNKVFSCYQSGQQPVYLYVKDGDKMSEYYSATTLADLDIGEDEHHTIHAGSLLTVTGTLNSPNAEQLVVLEGGQLMHHSEDAEGTFTKTVTGYPPSGNKGWTFVSSPLSSPLTPSVENGWLSGTYDLYAYDEATAVWRNHKAHPFTALENSTGYLYANATTATLSWTGTLHPCDGTVTVPLDYHPDQELSGWNLVGNPFTCHAYANRSHYRMNSEGSNMIAVLDYEDDPLPPCTGIMVKATESNDNVIFSNSQTLRKTTRKEWLEVQVVDPRNDNESLDKAFVCLHPEDGLEKYFFQATGAAIWIPFQDKAYAIVSIEETQELPVNFKVHKDGEYTITVSGPLSSHLSVLRFIDNLTGADIDLLLEPSYTFEAKTSDYASRFKLVFGNENNGSTNSPQENGNFAFISNGSLIINGEGTVQLYDVLGRILLTRETTPNSSLLTPHSPGAYVLRLIDGSGVKTQKIIVKP